MKSPALMVIFSLLANVAWSQWSNQYIQRKVDLSKEVAARPLRGPGSILTKAGDELKGSVIYYLGTNRVDVKSLAAGTLSLVAEDVTAFEFYDSLKAKQRIYYSSKVRYKDRKAKEEKVSEDGFLELVRQFSNFSLLSYDPGVNVVRKATGTAYYDPSNPYTPRKDKILIRETEVFLVARDGDVAIPYLRLSQSSVSKTSGRDVNEHESSDILDKEFLEVFFANKYLQVKKYIRDHSLKVDEPEDLAAILEFYDSIANN